MKIIKKSTSADGQELELKQDSATSWQGFVITGLPKRHQAHENKPKSLSAAVTLWNSVAQPEDRVSVKEVSSRLVSTAKH